MTKKRMEVSVECLKVGDELCDLPLVYTGRNYVPEPNYEGSTDQLGRWVGKAPENVWRYEFKTPWGPAYVFPHLSKNHYHILTESGSIKTLNDLPRRFHVMTDTTPPVPEFRSRGR